MPAGIARWPLGGGWSQPTWNASYRRSHMWRVRTGEQTREAQTARPQGDAHPPGFFLSTLPPTIPDTSHSVLSNVLHQLWELRGHIQAHYPGLMDTTSSSWSKAAIQPFDESTGLFTVGVSNVRHSQMCQLCAHPGFLNNNTQLPSLSCSLASVIPQVYTSQFCSELTGWLWASLSLSGPWGFHLGKEIGRALTFCGICDSRSKRLELDQLRMFSYFSLF